MAAKRLHDDESSSEQNPPNENKRIRTMPSFASVIGEAVMVNSIQRFCSALEPMLRRVVNEEVENTLKTRIRTFGRSPSLRIQAPEPSPSNLQLIFKKKLTLPIFTGSKIVDMDSNCLEIQLVQISDGVKIATSLAHPIKVEIVVLDGDFPSDDRNVWTSEEFDRNILKERAGKRPLLAGDCLTVTLRDGIAPIGEIEFTDNSSWIRSRKFRIGARVSPGSSRAARIREAMTDAFIVKDHRGELYKKHYPPMLKDEVWRLEKIGKDGAFHKKLTAANIKTVQEFLKLSTVNPVRLKEILGNGMSEKMWEVTIKHARTCDMGNKHYIFHGQDCTITLTPICQVVSAVINGQKYSIRDLPSIRGCIEPLVRQAYANWSSLQEVVGISSEMALLTQGEQLGDQYNNHHHHQSMLKAFHQIDEYSTDRYLELGSHSTNPNSHIGLINWHQAAAPVSPGIRYSVSESSSDGGELTPRSYFNSGN